MLCDYESDLMQKSIRTGNKLTGDRRAVIIDRKALI